MEAIGFIGTATVAIDSKGRTNLPRELRKQLPENSTGKVIVTLFADRSLALRPVEEWNRYVRDELEPMAKASAEGARFVMMVTSMARLSELDAQNRITLSPEQLRYAGIEKEVTFAGDGARIRLFQPQAYQNIVNIAGSPESMEACFYRTGNTGT